MRILVVALLVAISGGVAGRAKALGPEVVSFGVGALGVANWQFLDEPGDADVFYPGYAGFGGGAGLMFEARFLGILGLEIDVLRTTDQGSGTSTLNGVDIELTLSQAAWHVPVLAKAVLPLPLIAPYVVVGPQFVFPGEATAETRSAIGVPPQQATADSYVMLTAGIGMEIKLPLPVVDLRIPISVRGSYNPGTGSTLAERRTEVAPGQFAYRTEWQWVVAITGGVAAYF